MAKSFIVRRVVIAGIGSLVVACGMLAGIDDLHIGDCKGGKCEHDSSIDVQVPQPPQSEASVAVDTGVPCTGMQEPTSIRVGSVGNTFCIDQTEVTNAQYSRFLDAGPSASSQPGVCSWNKSFTPTRTAAQLDAGSPGDHPITDVDWCDALAYCSWVGKYLCGRIDQGKKVGAVTEEGLSDYKSHQWMLACSAEARLRYPYGGLFDPSKCNLKDHDAGGLVPVGSMPGCVGGFEDLHDMIGNAWEWYDGPCNPDGGLKIDAGEGSEADSCQLKGGAYDNVGAAFDCRFDLTNIRRDFHGANVGFRCCSD